MVHYNTMLTQCSLPPPRTSPELDDQPSARFCSTEFLIFGPDQTFDYVDCAANPGKQILFFSPTTASPPSASSSAATSSSSTDSLATSAQLSSQTPNTLSSPTTPASALGQDGGAPVNTGAIVGGTLGGLALLLGSGIAIVYLLRNNWARRSSGEDIQTGGETSQSQGAPAAGAAVGGGVAAAATKHKSAADWQRRELPAWTEHRENEDEYKPSGGGLLHYDYDGSNSGTVMGGGGGFAELPADYRSYGRD